MVMGFADCWAQCCWTSLRLLPFTLRWSSAGTLVQSELWWTWPMQMRPALLAPAASATVDGLTAHDAGPESVAPTLLPECRPGVGTNVTFQALSVAVAPVHDDSVVPSSPCELQALGEVEDESLSPLGVLVVHVDDKKVTHGPHQLPPPSGCSCRKDGAHRSRHAQHRRAAGSEQRRELPPLRFRRAVAHVETDVACARQPDRDADGKRGPRHQVDLTQRPRPGGARSTFHLPPLVQNGSEHPPDSGVLMPGALCCGGRDPHPALPGA
eukprot:6707644-Prymnesium_polylepis.1